MTLNDALSATRIEMLRGDVECHRGDLECLDALIARVRQLEAREDRMRFAWERTNRADRQWLIDQCTRLGELLLRARYDGREGPQGQCGTAMAEWWSGQCLAAMACHMDVSGGPLCWCGRPSAAEAGGCQRHSNGAGHHESEDECKYP